MALRIRKFITGREAVIAIEFAIVLPIMAALWFGIAEFGSAQLVARKVEVAAQSVADIIAQENTIDTAQLDDLAVAVNEILAPFPTAGVVGYEITSVTTDSGGTASVGWHYAGGTLAANTATASGLPTGVVSTDDSVIVVTVSYSHARWAAHFFDPGGNPIAMTETMYAKPRLTQAISCSDCP